MTNSLLSKVVNKQGSACLHSALICIRIKLYRTTGKDNNTKIFSMRYSAYRGFPTRMVYLHYISCLRYTILVGNPQYERERQTSAMFLLDFVQGLLGSLPVGDVVGVQANLHDGDEVPQRVLLLRLNCILLHWTRRTAQ